MARKALVVPMLPDPSSGIAVAAACLWFVFGPVGFFIEIAAFALGIAITRCVSVGSIAAAAICPLLALYFYWGQWVPWLIIAALAALELEPGAEDVAERAARESKGQSETHRIQSRIAEDAMREAFPLEGTPIRLKFKKKD